MLDLSMKGANCMLQIVRSRLPEHLNRKNAELGFEISQTQLARATKIRQATISEWMNPKPMERLDLTVVSKLANFFDVGLWDMLEIVEGDDSPEMQTYPTIGALSHRLVG